MSLRHQHRTHITLLHLVALPADTILSVSGSLPDDLRTYNMLLYETLKRETVCLNYIYVDKLNSSHKYKAAHLKLYSFSSSKAEL